MKSFAVLALVAALLAAPAHAQVVGTMTCVESPALADIAVSEPHTDWLCTLPHTGGSSGISGTYWSNTPVAIGESLTDASLPNVDQHRYHCNPAALPVVVVGSATQTVRTVTVTATVQRRRVPADNRSGTITCKGRMPDAALVYVFYWFEAPWGSTYGFCGPWSWPNGGWCNGYDFGYRW